MSDQVLNNAQIEALKSVDTPTICNAIEAFEERCCTEGYMGMNIRCLTPDFGTMLGYAVTVTVDSTTPAEPADMEAFDDWMRAMDAAPNPVSPSSKM